MKNTILGLVAVAAAFCALADGGPNASRAVEGKKVELPEFWGGDKLINRGWRFRTGDDEAWAAKDFDDSKWRLVDVPHDFIFELPWDKKNKRDLAFKPLGAAWYRKHFTPEADWRGRTVLVEFEGLMAVGDVYLNGEKVASSDYGYLGCVADIGGKLKWGEDNVLAVRCDAGHRQGSRWYTGGGIVRDVRLVVKSPVSIARHGVYVTTSREERFTINRLTDLRLNCSNEPNESLQSKIENRLIENANWNVCASVQLDGFMGQGNANRLDVILEVFDPGGRRMARGEAAAPWSKLAHQTVVLPPLAVENPRLWDIDAPNLYTAAATLKLNGTVIDRVKERFGFRTIEYGPDFGFRLNGRKVWLQGMANHADYGALGAAAYDRAIRRQFETMKRFGFNAVRCSHNPYSSGFLRLADEMGILVVDELIDKWTTGTHYWNGRRPFLDIWPDLLSEWVKRDRNHPSVILWSLGNELQQRENIAGYATDDWGVTTYRIFDALVKRWDATRPTTVAMFPAHKGSVARADPGFSDPDPEPPELSTVTEVASYNYLYDDYASYKRHNPNLVIFQSEASVHALQRPILAMDRATTVGLCYWGAIAYWGESDGWPKKGWCYSFFDRTLAPYPTAYLIKSFFSDEPVVRIGTVKGREVDGVVWNDIKVGRVNAAEDWNFDAGAKVLLYTYTNADEVELQVNGRTVGVKRNNRANIKEANAIRWAEVPYEAGAVTAIARTDGREVARHTIETAGEAVRLVAEAENAGDWKGDGQDLQYVRVRAVDATGRLVRKAADEVTFKVEGAATLLAVDDGDAMTDELFLNVDTKRLRDGSLLAILRSAPTPGPVTLTITSPAFPNATLKLQTAPCAAAEVKIVNDVFLRDGEGRAVCRQGGGIFKFGETYYRYGARYRAAQLYADRLDGAVPFEDRCGFEGVEFWTSDDFIEWRAEGVVLAPEELPRRWAGRLGVAKVDDEYALIIQSGDGVSVCTAASPRGPFRRSHELDMTAITGYKGTGDQTVFADEDTGKYYLIFSKPHGRDRTFVGEIGRGADGRIGLVRVEEVFAGWNREANSMFKHGGRYYLSASNIYGWDASLAYWLAGPTPFGPFERAPGADMNVMAGCERDYAHVSQVGFYYTLRGAGGRELVLYFGDRWSQWADNGAGFEVCVPLSFDEAGAPRFHSLSSWWLDPARAAWRVADDNNYCLNGSFDADRRLLPLAAKPRQEHITGWEVEVVRGNAISLANPDSPRLNVPNSAADHAFVTGKFALNFADTVPFERVVSQRIEDLPPGDYTLSWMEDAGGGWRRHTETVTPTNGVYTIAFRRSVPCRIDDVTLMPKRVSPAVL